MPALTEAQARELLHKVLTELWEAEHRPIVGARLKAVLLRAASTTGSEFDERAIGYAGFADFVSKSGIAAVKFRTGTDILIAPADQSEALATFINYLGTTISIIFSIGAIIGAMITMYASVASRTAEIGTLRALGFSRAAILVAFLGESLLLGLLGGVLGLAGAAFMQTLSISTTNFQTFAEVAFRFVLTPGIAIVALLFSLGMGFVGGFLPAARAARLKIVDALRAA